MSKVFEISFENYSKFGKMKWKLWKRFKNWNEKRQEGKGEKWNENNFYIVVEGITFSKALLELDWPYGLNAPVERKPYIIKRFSPWVLYP